MSAEQDATTFSTGFNQDLAFTAPINFTAATQKQLANQDILDGLEKWRIWVLFAYQDIKLRYRRSILGPFWITLSMAITVYAMGFLYSHLFHMPASTYFPYLVAGMLGWSLVSVSITDLVDTFTSTDNLIKQIKLPYSLYIHRVAMRNFLIFFHNLLVYVPILFIFPATAKINWHFFWIFPGLILIYINAFCYGIVLAMLGSRYRDISQIIKSLISVIFFMTPIMWNPNVLPASKRFVVMLNPIYSLIELVRAPLMGYSPTTANLLIVFTLTLFGAWASYALFSRRRARIIYWI